ncbi:MAG: 2OG-Fe(II) oxygenase [Pseudomonadota bacterium]|nr:2OG-Fe(II) oxygenase [Pseudomonadota bacterium]MDE3037202.1 2OG-Fe(II) oxygenase [Pseudomonadota bacterium]
MQNLAAQARHAPLLNLDVLAAAPPLRDPYPHVLTAGMLSPADMPTLKRDFPDIAKTGFLPLSALQCEGAFADLIAELQGADLAAILSDKLGLELRDKPRMITIRKWSAGNDGRIHNDGEAKIATSLLYLNDTWPEGDGGRLRVLRSNKSFDDTALEVPPIYGTFFAFARADNSWHGHKPFSGERRVVQITWLRSQEDYDRKEKRGKFALLMKKIFKGSEY